MPDRLTAALQQLAQLDEGDLGEALRSILAIDAEALQLERVGYWELAADHTAMSCRMLHRRDSGTYHEGGELAADELPRFVAALVASPTAVVCDDATLHAGVLRRGVLVGVISHEHAGCARTWSSEEHAFARAVAQAVVNAVETAERRRTDEAARLAAVNVLAGGVAHEINNPLTYINANLVSALTELETGGFDRDLLRDMLNDAYDGAERIRRIVEGMTELARARPTVLEPIGIHAVIDAAIERLNARLRARATVRSEYAPTPCVRIDGARLGQVLSHLLINAAQAIPDGDPRRHEIRICTRTGVDGDAVIEVHDTGSGIPAEMLGQIFLPFFTSKPIGTGPGLGLSLCQAIITSAGGRIDVESRASGGTTVRVTLPADRASVHKPSTITPGRRRVLLVDDEAPIRRILCRMLEPAHDVLVADSGERALAHLRGGESFDVVLCDLMMPEMTGMELYAHLVAEQPTIAKRTIFMTGGSFSIRSREFLATCDRPLLEKPIDRTMLRRAIAAVEP